MSEKYFAPSPADLGVRVAVEEYIESAVASGHITKSDIQIDPKTFAVTGWTHVETESGVRIASSTLGYLELSAEFEEGVPPVDVRQTIRLFPGLRTEVTEQVDGGQTHTVPSYDHGRIAAEMAKLVKAVY